MLNILSKKYDIGFNSFQKINFKKKSHLNSFGCKFDLDIKKVKVNLVSSFV